MLNTKSVAVRFINDVDFEAEDVVDDEDAANRSSSSDESFPPFPFR